MEVKIEGEAIVKSDRDAAVSSSGQRVGKRVLQVEKRVLRMGKRVLRVLRVV